jgi:ferric-dicitrate binding protein FerR (iron transport regulator)
MTDPGNNDSTWQAALGWVMAAHEAPADERVREQLAAWLAADPAHRAAYEEASSIWLLTGLVPPTGDPADDTPPREPRSATGPAG